MVAEADGVGVKLGVKEAVCVGVAVGRAKMDRGWSRLIEPALARCQFNVMGVWPGVKRLKPNNANAKMNKPVTSLLPFGVRAVFLTSRFLMNNLLRMAWASS